MIEKKKLIIINILITVTKKEKRFSFRIRKKHIKRLDLINFIITIKRARGTHEMNTILYIY